MNCYSCTHCDTCYMRIQLARAVQSFKYLASDSIEAKNAGTKSSVNSLWVTLAKACTKFESKKDKTNPLEAEAPTDFPSEGQCSSCFNYTKVSGNPPLCSMCEAKP